MPLQYPNSILSDQSQPFMETVPCCGSGTARERYSDGSQAYHQIKGSELMERFKRYFGMDQFSGLGPNKDCSNQTEMHPLCAPPCSPNQSNPFLETGRNFGSAPSR